MFEGKVAVITGAASGIGRGLAKIAGQRGMKLVLADIDEAGLNETASLVQSQTLAVVTDVAQSDAVENLARRAFVAFGQVDLLFNNAGILRGGLSWEIDLNEWQRTLQVNLMSVVHGIAAFVPRMIEQETPSRIINTASIGGFISSPYIAPYTATKFAVVALTEALAIELQMKATNVSVSLLAPGAVRSAIYSDPRTSSFDDATRDSVKAMGNFTQETGVDPDTFAEATFEGIEAGRFWLIGQQEVFGDAIADRVQRALAGINPHPQHYGMATTDQAA